MEVVLCKICLLALLTPKIFKVPRVLVPEIKFYKVANFTVFYVFRYLERGKKPCLRGEKILFFRPYDRFFGVLSGGDFNVFLFAIPKSYSSA